MNILDINNLSFGYDDKTILKNISLRLLSGDHAGLVGDNGAGKTTLFNILTGRLIADSGNVKWAKNIKIGYLNQHIKLNENESIFNNLKDAFKELYDLEKEMNLICSELSNVENTDMENKLDRLGKIQETLMINDFYNVESVIKDVANGLGLSALGLDTKASKLSGGQRTKLSLAKLLLKKPDVLLLDEPTNYLDKEHVDWLSNYLNNYKNSFIVISHDTEFLNRITNVIFSIEFCILKRYNGNYKNYKRLSKIEKERYVDDYNRQQKQIQKMENFIDKNIVRAATTKRAQSRRKQLEKIERMEKPKTQQKPNFNFLTCRHPGKLIFKSSKLDIGYTYPVIKGLDLKLLRGQKVAVTGCNGIGKSTMLKTILGVIPKLSGDIKYGEFIKPAYFEQETKFNNDVTALEEVWDNFPQKTQKEIREALAKCGLRNDHVLHNMNQLSGGEQAKVSLCKIMLTPCNWLILDEPTNHLDVESKEVLKDALSKFDGTILLVSHEKDFYENWVTNVWDMESLANVSTH